MSVAWPCNFGRNAILKHRESFASGSSFGKNSDMNVQGTENTWLELTRVRVSAPRLRVAVQFVSIGRWSQQVCEVFSGEKDVLSAPTFRSSENRG